MFNLFGKKEETVAPEMVSKAVHMRIVKELRDDCWDLKAQVANLTHDLQQERNSVGNMIQRNRELQTQPLAARAEAEANKVDAELWRNAREKRKNKRKPVIADITVWNPPA